MKEGSTFGENSLRESSEEALRSASIIAEGEVICLSISRKTIVDNFGKSLKHIVFKNQQRNILNKSAVLSKFLSWQRERLMNHLIINDYKKGDLVFKKDQEYNNLYFFGQGR